MRMDGCAVLKEEKKQSVRDGGIDGLPAAILLARLLRLLTFFESQDIDVKGPRTGCCKDDEWLCAVTESVNGEQRGGRGYW